MYQFSQQSLESFYGYTVWESTDECYKQYRYGSTPYSLSNINFTYKIIIDRMIGAPDHGKDIVDGINASDKRYWKGKMYMIKTLEADNYSDRIKAHSMICNAHYSFQKSTRGYVNIVKEITE